MQALGVKNIARLGGSTGIALPALDAQTLLLDLNGSIGAGSFTRASNAWNPESGDIAPHNVFLNSATGVTQGITLTAVPQVLSFKGTGSITLSGTATGSLAGTGAANRVSLAFTPTAGSVTFTVAGSCSEVQVNQWQITDYVPTGATAVYLPRYVSGKSGQGYLPEETSTNVFLSSSNIAIPATQSIALTTANGGTWTCTVTGAGTVTSSAGTATATGYGVASAGAKNTVTVTVNGTVTYTVAGANATTRVNVENLPYGTSPIWTAGVAATRAAEILTHPTSGYLTAAQGTISCWVKVDSTIQADSQFHFIFYEEAALNVNQIAMYKTNVANRWFFATRNAAGALSSVNVLNTLSNGWHMFTCVWGGSFPQLYIDGVLGGTAVSNNIPDAVATNFYVGSVASGLIPADMPIDQLRIYNRVLTQDEITRLYRSQR